MKALTIFKTAVSYFGTFCVGVFVCLAVEYGFDPMIIAGLVLSPILAIGAGIGAHQDREDEWQEAMWAEVEQYAADPESESTECEEG